MATTIEKAQLIVAFIMRNHDRPGLTATSGDWAVWANKDDGTVNGWKMRGQMRVSLTIDAESERGWVRTYAWCRMSKGGHVEWQLVDHMPYDKAPDAVEQFVGIARLIEEKA